MNGNKIHCINVLCKFVFSPTCSNPRWWYVIQISPQSRHIFDEGGIEEVLPKEAMDDEQEMTNFTSGEPHLDISKSNRRGSKEDTSSNNSSN